MSFADPVALAALLVVPAALAFAIWIRRTPSAGAVAFTNLDVLGSVVERRRSWRPWLPVVLLLLALTLASTAIARPHVNLLSHVDNASVVLLVDVSSSMRADDVEPTRLDAATAAMRSFLDLLPERYRVGLVQFSATAEVLERPTHDRELVRQTLAYLQPDTGTAIGDGLATATAVLDRALHETGANLRPGAPPAGAIVLLSDGTQTNGRRSAMQGAAIARRSGYPVYTVALGTAGGYVQGPGNVLLPVTPDPELMEAIAAATGGTTFTAENAPATRDVFTRLTSLVGRETKSREITSWLALAAAGLLLGAVGLGRAVAGALSG